MIDAGAIFHASCGTMDGFKIEPHCHTLFTKLNCFWLCGKSDKWSWESNLSCHSGHYPAHFYTECQSYYDDIHIHNYSTHNYCQSHRTQSFTFCFFLSHTHTHTHTHTLTNPPTPGSSTPTSASPSPVQASNYNVTQDRLKTPVQLLLQREKM